MQVDAAMRSLRGVALGDSLGLVYEGLKNGRGLRLYPFPLRQRLIFGRGFVSDDTVQSAIVLVALKRSEGDVERFGRELAKGLRAWFLSAPPGIGLSTIKACLRLCLGVNWRKSGVYSGGNGAAMRVAVLGAVFSNDDENRVRFVDVCSRVTHTHPLAVAGAQVVALAAALEVEGRVDEFDELVAKLEPDWPWDQGWSDSGPSGYVVESVNAAVAIWRKRLSLLESMEEVVRLGGDTDTIGAIVGGMMGADLDDVESDLWRIMGWPGLEDIGERVPYFRLLGSHLVELPIILANGFRRLLPPF